MKKIRIMYIAVLIFFTTILFSNAETIKNYDVIIQVNRDKTLVIKEKIEYEFDTLDRRGIIRDIFYRKKSTTSELGRSIIKINEIKKNGKKEKYETKYLLEGKEVKIGNPNANIDRLLNTYDITYTLYNEIAEGEGNYQIYFNAIPNFWEVPIENALVTIKFPNGHQIREEEIRKLEVYTGASGEKGENYEIIQKKGEIKIKTKNPLSQKNGLTVFLLTDTDSINPTTDDKKRIEFYLNPMKKAAPVILIFLALYCFITWIIYGRDPSKRSIIPQFTPPEDISSMYMYCIDKKLKKKRIDGNKLITVGILSLLSKGYITAEDETGDGKNVKYFLNSTEEIPSENVKAKRLLPSEKEVLNSLSKKNGIFSKSTKIYDTRISISNDYEKKYDDEMYNKNTILKIPAIFIVSFLIFLILFNSESENPQPKRMLIVVMTVILTVTILSLYIHIKRKMILREGTKAKNKLYSFDNVGKVVAITTVIILCILTGFIFSDMKVEYVISILFSALSTGLLIVLDIFGIGKKIIGVIFKTIGIFFLTGMLLYSDNGKYGLAALFICIIYTRIIERLTDKGMRSKEIIDGMKMYMKTAEERQIMQFNDVDELVNFFRIILPFAVALGIENQAIKQMEKLIARYNFLLVKEALLLTTLSVSLQNEIKSVSGRVYNNLKKTEHINSKNSSGGGGYSSGGVYSGGGSGGGGGRSW